MPRIVQRPQAEDDLLDLFVYIGRRSVRAANRFLNAVDKAMDKLADMPYLGALCESGHPALAGLRAWSIRGFRKYLLLYRPLEDGIEVLRVIHGARDIENLFRK